MGRPTSCPPAVGSIKATFEKYTHMTWVLPAMGHGDKQTSELEQTINTSECNLVPIGTLIDLGKLPTIDNRSMCVRYLTLPGRDGSLGAEVQLVACYRFPD